MIKRYRRTATTQYLIVILITLSIIGIGLLSAFVMSFVPFLDEFALPWAAGRMWLLDGESPYSQSAIQDAESAIDESNFLGVLPDSQVLRHPLLNLLFYLPFKLLFRSQIYFY